MITLHNSPTHTAFSLQRNLMIWYEKVPPDLILSFYGTFPENLLNGLCCKCNWWSLALTQEQEPHRQQTFTAENMKYYWDNTVHLIWHTSLTLALETKDLTMTSVLGLQFCAHWSSRWRGAAWWPAPAPHQPPAARPWAHAFCTIQAASCWTNQLSSYFISLPFSVAKLAKCQTSLRYDTEK